jgi:hypothetical protein
MAANVTIDGVKFQGAHNTAGSLSGLGSGGGICVYLLGARSSTPFAADFPISLPPDI